MACETSMATWTTRSAGIGRHRFSSPDVPCSLLCSDPPSASSSTIQISGGMVHAARNATMLGCRSPDRTAISWRNESISLLSEA